MGFTGSAKTHLPDPIWRPGPLYVLIHSTPFSSVHISHIDFKVSNRCLVENRSIPFFSLLVTNSEVMNLCQWLPFVEGFEIRDHIMNDISVELDTKRRTRCRCSAFMIQEFLDIDDQTLSKYLLLVPISRLGLQSRMIELLVIIGHTSTWIWNLFGIHVLTSERRAGLVFKRWSICVSSLWFNPIFKPVPLTLAGSEVIGSKQALRFCNDRVRSFIVTALQLVSSSTDTWWISYNVHGVRWEGKMYVV